MEPGKNWAIIVNFIGGDPPPKQNPTYATVSEAHQNYLSIFVVLIESFPFICITPTVRKRVHTRASPFPAHPRPSPTPRFPSRTFQ